MMNLRNQDKVLATGQILDLLDFGAKINIMKLVI